MAAFQGYLSNIDVRELKAAAVDSGLLLIPRALLLNGLPPAYAAGIPYQPAPLDQFGLDLVHINGTERLANGVVPLVVFLENIAAELRLRQQPLAATFEEKLARVSNRAGGVPPLPQPAALPEIIANEAIIGDDDMVDVAFLARGIEIAGTVARIRVPRFENGAAVKDGSGGPWIMNGTAWLIAPNVGITNCHVINARRSDEPPASANDFALQAANSVLEFDLDSKAPTVISASVTRVIGTSTELDYALLAVSGAPARHLPSLVTKPIAHGPTTRMSVNIMQHPRGEPKRIALRNNLVSGADATTLRYFTDTDLGSSGSPVCDDQWRVVALHRGAQWATGV
jgi:endonuclease G